MMLRDSIALRTEVETRIWMGVHMLAKLAVMGVHMDLSPPYLEPLLINKKVVADNRRFKRRDAAQIPPNTATRRMVSTESNAQRTQSGYFVQICHSHDHFLTGGAAVDLHFRV